MHAERTRSEYCFPVDTEQFIALERWDDCPLLEELEKLGADNIEYDGHFGANVFYRLAAENDTEEKHAAIAACIQRNLNKATAIK